MYEARLKYKELINILNEENSTIKTKIINMKVKPVFFCILYYIFVN